MPSLKDIRVLSPRRRRAVRLLSGLRVLSCLWLFCLGDVAPTLKRSSGLPVPVFSKDQCKVLGCLGRGIVPHPPPGLPIGHSWSIDRSMLGRPGSRRRAIHSPCDSKPGGKVTEWVRRDAARGFWSCGCRRPGPSDGLTCLAGSITGRSRRASFVSRVASHA